MSIRYKLFGAFSVMIALACGLAFYDLVDIVAAYGFDYRTAAEATVASARTKMLALALGTTVLGLIIAIAFAYSLSKPILPRCVLRGGLRQAPSPTRSKFAAAM